MRLAVIPARGGSKRIPRKNLKLFGGKPIIAWSIKAALESKCFDKIIVSTDDAEIAAVANLYGADTPFVRPPELSDDYTTTVPVIAHAINWFKLNQKIVTEACCIYATAPFLDTQDLNVGLEMLLTTKATYVFSVTSYPYPIERAIRINKDNRVEMVAPQYLNTRSQDLETAWHDAAQFYWGFARSWLSGRAILGPESVPVPLPRYRVQDIDTIEDWNQAEMIYIGQNRNKNE
jgi:pseudaminic acid cytidylyltransferase